MRRLYEVSQWIVVGALAFFLPFTSFPLVARLTGSSMVAPLSLLPLGLLALLWFAPYLARAGRLPFHARPLLFFTAAALFASLIAFFRVIPPFKGASLASGEVRALVTLAVGLLFYLVIAVWLNTPERLRFFLRWVNWGGGLAIAWSVFQAGIWQWLEIYPDWMWNFQGQISTSLLLYVARSTGFAYEPSWLAHQLNMLYLPFWLACAATGYTAHRFRLGKVHFEHLLLVGGIATLVFSVSRIGLLTFLLMFAFLLLLWNIRLVRWLQNTLARRLRVSGARLRAARAWIAAASAVLLLVIYLALGLGAAYGLSRYDLRMAKMFDFTALREQSFIYYANQLVFAERLVFWQAGWEIFNSYPLVGVGLGNAGYYFPEKLSAFSWALTEIRTLIYQQSELPNIKSLWVRLLAETGIAGFSLFACWCYLLWRSAAFLRALRDPLWRTVGLAGSFALIGFLIEGFSIDSFAMPYYWITFGVITAACEAALLATARLATARPATARPAAVRALAGPSEAFAQAAAGGSSGE